MIPRSVRIRGHTYKIKHVNARDMGEGNIAEVDSHLNHILVYKRMAASKKITYILHEALHAMLEGTEFQEEEAMVTILGQGLTEFIQANPHFLKYAIKTLG